MNNLDLVSTGKIPYYCVQLTTDQMEQVKDKKMEIYACDGKVFFPVRDEHGKPMGDYVFYIMFK